MPVEGCSGTAIFASVSGGAAEGGKVYVNHAVLHRSQRLCHTLRRSQFCMMALAVVHTQRVTGITLLPRQCQHGGGIQSAG